MKEKNIIIGAILACSMGITAVSANYIKPTIFLSDTRATLKIEPSIPTEFAEWKLAEVGGGIVNPQQEAILNSIYSEIITRTYVNKSGQQIMLSIAYGKNQHDSFQVHKPEICYPAQGFVIKTNSEGVLNTRQGSIRVRRLETTLGEIRQEHVTYWVTIGDNVVVSNFDKKIKEIEYAVDGYIPDGLLFRISSIGPDGAFAFKLQTDFIQDFINSLSNDDRHRLTGI